MRFLVIAVLGCGLSLGAFAKDSKVFTFPSGQEVYCPDQGVYELFKNAVQDVAAQSEEFNATTWRRVTCNEDKKTGFWIETDLARESFFVNKSPRPNIFLIIIGDRKLKKTCPYNRIFQPALAACTWNLNAPVSSGL